MVALENTDFFRLPLRLWNALKEDAEARLPEEACGLASGRGRQLHAYHPLENTLHSPVRYQMNPAEQIRLMLDFEEAGENLLAICHSHPAGPAFPSQTDVEEASYPDAIYIILSPGEADWICRGFRIRNQHVMEVSILIED